MYAQPWEKSIFECNLWLLSHCYTISLWYWSVALFGWFFEFFWLVLFSFVIISHILISKFCQTFRTYSVQWDTREGERGSDYTFGRKWLVHCHTVFVTEQMNHFTLLFIGWRAGNPDIWWAKAENCHSSGSCAEPRHTPTRWGHFRPWQRERGYCPGSPGQGMLWSHNNCGGTSTIYSYYRWHYCGTE